MTCSSRNEEEKFKCRQEMKKEITEFFVAIMDRLDGKSLNLFKNQIENVISQNNVLN